MTLALAFKWPTPHGESVVICTDTRVTIGDHGNWIVSETRKIHSIISDNNKYLGIISGAGDLVLIKWACEVADKVMKEYAGEDGLIFFDEVRQAVRKMEEIFMDRFSRLLTMGIEPEFELVLSSVDLDGKASLYQFDYRGLAEPVHNSPGCAIIGSGAINGGILLLKLLGYPFVIRDLSDLEYFSEIEPDILATFILDVVSQVDPSVGSFVGECFKLEVIEENGEKRVDFKRFNPKAVIQNKLKVAQRIELIRYLWRLCDKKGEDKVRKALDKLMSGELD